MVTKKIGILQRAARLGMIASLADDISQLRETGMFLSDSLVAKILGTS